MKGGRLKIFQSVKVREGSLDAAIIAARLFAEKKKKPIDFGKFDFITDAVNLQKLFAFAQEAGDGLFRIDCERVGNTVLLTRCTIYYILIVF